MSSQLSTTKRITSDNKWEVTASVIPGGSLPLDIFMYSYGGGDSVLEYQGVTQLDDYHSRQTFVGTPIPVFGNKFVKTTQAKIIMDIKEDPDVAISVIIKDVITLSVSLQNSVSTTIITNIP